VAIYAEGLVHVVFGLVKSAGLEEELAVSGEGFFNYDGRVGLAVLEKLQVGFLPFGILL
jgi:hypothetical protein